MWDPVLETTTHPAIWRASTAIWSIIKSTGWIPCAWPSSVDQLLKLGMLSPPFGLSLLKAKKSHTWRPLAHTWRKSWGMRRRLGLGGWAGTLVEPSRTIPSPTRPARGKLGRYDDYPCDQSFASWLMKGETHRTGLTPSRDIGDCTNEETNQSAMAMVENFLFMMPPGGW